MSAGKEFFVYFVSFCSMMRQEHEGISRLVLLGANSP